MRTVSVAIPVLNGGASFREVLPAIARQRIDAEVELVVADSGSTDGTREFALAQGAKVVDVAPGTFSHGGTRNLLMEHSSGDHVAFLTDDALPAADDWLEHLVGGFAAGRDVALAYGPYVPRPDASPMVARELTEFFASLSPDGSVRIDRGLRPEDRRPGPVTFHTDANGCLARWAWERVPFRQIGSAEDQAIAVDMLEAGYAKAYVPGAAVVHSHDYSLTGWFGRFFDEFRALREVYGHVEEVGLRYTLGTIRRNVRRDRAYAAARGDGEVALRSAAFHSLRAAGAVLGTRADLLPPRVRAWCSADGRTEFRPLVDARPV
ncbi:MAG: glycosyltransferase family 2 protein [Thermoleophilaceae bacterium]